MPSLSVSYMHYTNHRYPATQTDAVRTAGDIHFNDSRNYNNKINYNNRTYNNNRNYNNNRFFGL